MSDEIERLIIEKHVVMNQLSILNPLFVFFPDTSVEDIYGIFCSSPSF